VPIQIDNIVGVILAGGNSSRMGRDKALLVYRGKPFIQLIADEFKNVFKEVIIISDNRKEYDFLGLPIYQDIYKKSGPLAGIHTALSITKKDVFVTSCDFPLVNKNLILSLLKISNNEEIIIFSVNGLLQPLFGIYKFSCLKKLESEIEVDNLSVHGFVKKCKTKVYDSENFLNKDVTSFLMNINSPEQYQALLKMHK
jgi:molybdopterin-guanine dinucleotide biosynthesis protein A